MYGLYIGYFVDGVFDCNGLFCVELKFGGLYMYLFGCIGYNG